MPDWLTLTPFLLAVGATAVTGSRYRPGQWYDRLAKPIWTPPSWLFPIAWTILYAMIAIAGWLVWWVDGIGLALGIWVVQLVLNAAWSWLMFGRRDIAGAAVDVTGLWLSIAAFIAVAWPASETAAWLFVPYLVWVSYAAALNIRILQLNGARGPA